MREADSHSESSMEQSMQIEVALRRGFGSAFTPRSGYKNSTPRALLSQLLRCLSVVGTERENRSLENPSKDLQQGKYRYRVPGGIKKSNGPRFPRKASAAGPAGEHKMKAAIRSCGVILSRGRLGPILRGACGPRQAFRQFPSLRSYLSAPSVLGESPGTLPER